MWRLGLFFSTGKVSQWTGKGVFFIVPLFFSKKKSRYYANSIYDGIAYVHLPDFNAYVVRKGQALSDYACDPKGWRRKCLVNIAKAGMFSSDRTIAEYDRDIWHLGE